jgi:hypothetical protein
MRRTAVALAALLVAGSAAGHDSWFSPSREGAQPGQLRLELSTGNRYPVQEFNPTAQALVRSQCTDGAGPPIRLRPGRNQPKWLELRAQARSPKSPLLACWLEMRAYELEMEADKVQVYFDEIRAPQELRAAWSGLQARGVPWRESYRKFARIELPFAPGTAPDRVAQARRPAGLDLEIVVQGEQPIAVGRPLTFQVLRDGQPLAGLAVELVSERSALGIWRESDAQGVVRHTLPFAGRWLLRATELRLDETDATRWRSRFVTLAIEAR